MYIADGHHRAASAYNVAKRRKEIAISQGKIITGNEDFNYFLTISFPTSQVKILDYNRVVKDLNNKTDEEFLSGLAENFEIFGLSEPKPTEKHMFSMFFRGE